LYNEAHVGAMANIVKGICLLECAPEDVVLVLDGDDWLFNADVLSKLNDVYARGDVDLTYGQYQNYPDGKKGYCRPVSQEVIAKRNYRRARWTFYQLRTFRHFLWEAVCDEDLRDSKGEYVSVAYDVAMMFPMLEMVGERFKFIEEVLYVYNIANPINDHKMRKKFLHETERYLRQKPKYDLLQR
jgi:glycosyltransferase involved in cell wall biosynthesis